MYLFCRNNDLINAPDHLPRPAASSSSGPKHRNDWSDPNIRYINVSQWNASETKGYQMIIGHTIMSLQNVEVGMAEF
jgi:hypothetical protein